MTEAHDSFEALRAAVDEVLEHAKHDPAFFAELQDHPQDTLEAAGLPGWAVDQLVFKEWGLADVTGHQQPELRQYTVPPCGKVAPPDNCGQTTCWFGLSWCRDVRNWTN